MPSGRDAGLAASLDPGLTAGARFLGEDQISEKRTIL